VLGLDVLLTDFIEPRTASLLELSLCLGEVEIFTAGAEALDGIDFGGLEGVVPGVCCSLDGWDELDVHLGGSSNVCNGFLCQLYSCLSVLKDNVSSDVWLAMRTIDNDTVVGTLLYLVSPDEWHRSSSVIITNDLDTILMGLGYLVIENLRFVVLDLNSHSTNLDFILDDISINIKGRDDR